MTYKHYRATEKRLYDHGIQARRIGVLMLERQAIINRIMPSVGVPAYGEHIGKSSDTLDQCESWAEQSLKDSKKLWGINREIDTLEVSCHLINYAMAVLTQRERCVVKARYFDGLPMQKVSDICCYTERQCWRIKDNSIWKIGRVLYGE